MIDKTKLKHSILKKCLFLIVFLFIIIYLTSAFETKQINSNLINVSLKSDLIHLNLNYTSPPWNNLVLYYSFDENTSSTTVDDYSTNNYDGAITGQVYPSIGKYGNGMKFDGSTDYITQADSLLDDVFNQSYSLCTWLNLTPQSVIQSQEFFDKWGGGFGNNNIQHLSVETSGQVLFFGYEYISGVGWSIAGTINITDSKWHHVCYTVERYHGKGNGTLYIDSVIDGKGNVTSVYNAKTTANVIIGANVAPTYSEFNGTLDDYLIFNISLSKQQISDIYNEQSLRFYSTGNVNRHLNHSENISTGDNKLNLTFLTNPYSPSDSKIMASIGYYNTSWYWTSPLLIYNNMTTIFNIDLNAKNVTVNFTLISGGNSSVTPILPLNYSFITWYAKTRISNMISLYKIPFNIKIDDGKLWLDFNTYNSTWLNFDGINDYVYFPTSTGKRIITLWYQNKTSNWTFIANATGQQELSYVNNNLNTFNEYPVYQNANGYYIGKTGTSSFFNGSIDDFRILSTNDTGLIKPLYFNRGEIYFINRTLISNNLTGIFLKSDGTLYGIINNDVRKSTDNGETIGPNLCNDCAYRSKLFIDSRGTFFSVANSNLTFSYGNETNWTSIDVFACSHAGGSVTSTEFWNMDEDNYGNLYMGEYSLSTNSMENCSYIHKSTDGGFTWSIVLNMSANSACVVSNRHSHGVKVDKTTGYIYAIEGEWCPKLFRSVDNGTTWSAIQTGVQYTTIEFSDDGCMLLGTDSSKDNKIMRTCDDSTFDTVLDLTNTGYDGQFLYSTKDNKGNIYMSESGLTGNDSYVFISRDNGTSWKHGVYVDSETFLYNFVNNIGFASEKGKTYKIDISKFDSTYLALNENNGTILYDRSSSRNGIIYGSLWQNDGVTKSLDSQDYTINDSGFITLNGQNYLYNFINLTWEYKVSDAVISNETINLTSVVGGGGGGLTPQIIAKSLGIDKLDDYICNETYHSILKNGIYYGDINDLIEKIKYKTNKTENWMTIRIYIDNWQSICSDTINRTLEPKIVCEKIYHFILANNYKYSLDDIITLKEELKPKIEISYNLLDYYVYNHLDLCYSLGYSEKLPKKPIPKIIVYNGEVCEFGMENSFLKANTRYPELFLGNMSCSSFKKLNWFINIEGNYMHGIRIWFLVSLIFAVFLLWFFNSNRVLNKIMKGR